MRYTTLIALVILATWSVVAQADYYDGLRAWDEGRHADALQEWQGAADDGEAHAMLALGHLFVEGLGAPQDYVKAYMWFSLAASRNVLEAVAERNALAERMTAEQIARAQELASAWHPGATRSDGSSAELTPSAPPPEAVREAQELLSALGYQPGPPDGQWGDLTADAYRLFLSDAGLPTADVLTPSVLSVMRELAVSQPAPAAGSTLHEAAISGDVNTVQAILATSVDVNARDSYGRTALMHAVDRGYIVIVPLLLEAGANPEIQAPDGATALFIAAVHGHAEIIALLMKTGADVTVRGPQGKTPVDVARVVFGDPAAARSRGEDPAVIALVQGMTWAEAQEEAVAWNEVIPGFVEIAGRPPSVDEVDANGWTDLHWAAVLNMPRLAELLLDKGASVDHRLKDDELAFSGQLHVILDRVVGHLGYRDEYSIWKRNGYSALHIAAMTNAIETAEVLIAHGADVNFRDIWLNTPSHYASWYGTFEMVQLFLDHGADVHAKSEGDTTLLHGAAGSGFPRTVELLIAHGANVNAQTEFNDTPLHYTVWQDSTETVELLIAHGANVNARNTSNDTPLHLAAWFNSTETVELLITHGANVNAKAKTFGLTPLHKAAWQNSAESAQVLIAHGANVNARDNYSRTPLDWAITQNSDKVEVLLRSLTRNTDSKSTGNNNSRRQER